MSIGVILTDDDLMAVRKLYATRWTADIKNWKERDTPYCIWTVTCPNRNNTHITESGQSLADTINKVLDRVQD